MNVRMVRRARCVCSAAFALLTACAGGRANLGGADQAGLSANASGAPSANTLTVVTLNIWHNQGDWLARLDYMVNTLRELNPDVIGLQEVLQNPELPNQAETIAQRLGYRFYFTSVDTPGSAKRYGNAILTRHPILVENFHKLEPLNDYRVAAHVRIRVGADTIDVYNTHLHHTAEGGAIRRTQLLDLRAFVAATRARGPVILIGDFNAPSTEPAVRTLDDLFTDTYGELHPNTQVTTLNPAMGHAPVRIDHIFYGRSPALRPLSAEIILDRPNAAGLWASDHFGLVARLGLPRR